MIPGEYFIAPGHITGNVGRLTVTLTVVNTGDRPVQIGSHYHFFEVNPQLAFARDLAFGKRLNIAAGTAVRFEPGEEKEVTLVELAGAQRVFGFHNLVNGAASGEKAQQQSLNRAEQAGFKTKEG